MHAGTTKLQHKFNSTFLAAQSSLIHPAHMNRTSALIGFVEFFIWLSPPSSVLCTASSGNCNTRSNAGWRSGVTEKQTSNTCGHVDNATKHLPRHKLLFICHSLWLWISRKRYRSQRRSVVDNNRKEEVNMRRWGYICVCVYWADLTRDTGQLSNCSQRLSVNYTTNTSLKNVNLLDAKKTSAFMFACFIVQTVWRVLWAWEVSSRVTEEFVTTECIKNLKSM